ncbi:MAG: hypothetical protein Q8N17_26205 [Burkholderiaceae bacterium]|nr:hypothetical protein [Burkholderiaceae bacterium]
MTTIPARRNPGKRLLGPGYADVLRVFANGPATWLDVAATLSTGRATAQTLCHGLNRQKLIHVASWRPVSGSGRSVTPVYALGDGVDAPSPTKRHGSAMPTKYELLGFCNLITALQTDSWHCKALADHLGHDPRTVRSTIKALHQNRLVCIDDYFSRPHGGAGYPLYTWGPDQEDAKKPSPKRGRVLWANSKARGKAKLEQMRLMHAMVHGVSLDARRASAANLEPAEAVA